MVILKRDFCDLFVWTTIEKEGNYILIRVEKDGEFIKGMLPLLEKYFKKCLLTEIVTRENDVCPDNKQKYYCICHRPCFEPMIACNKPNCTTEWYHYPCVNVTWAPKGEWICPNCLKK